MITVVAVIPENPLKYFSIQNFFHRVPYFPSFPVSRKPFSNFLKFASFIIPTAHSFTNGVTSYKMTERHYFIPMKGKNISEYAYVLLRNKIVVGNTDLLMSLPRKKCRARQDFVKQETSMRRTRRQAKGGTNPFDQTFRSGVHCSESTANRVLKARYCVHQISRGYASFSIEPPIRIQQGRSYKCLEPRSRSPFHSLFFPSFRFFSLSAHKMDYPINRADIHWPEAMVFSWSYR